MPHPDYEEFVAALNAHGVRYLIGGAHAVAFHARPRASKDIDIFIDPSPANARRAVAAVAAFFGGTAPKYVTTESLCDPDTILQLGVAPVRIDLISGLAGGRPFYAAWKRRAEAHFGSEPAHYLSLDDLIAEKEHWRRPQDRADLVVLRKVVARGRRR